MLNDSWCSYTFYASRRVCYFQNGSIRNHQLVQIFCRLLRFLTSDFAISDGKATPMSFSQGNPPSLSYYSVGLEPFQVHLDPFSHLAIIRFSNTSEGKYLGRHDYVCSLSSLVAEVSICHAFLFCILENLGNDASYGLPVIGNSVSRNK